MKRQLASLQSVIDCLMEVSAQYQLDHVSGRYLLRNMNCAIWQFYVKILFLSHVLRAKMSLLLCALYRVYYAVLLSKIYSVIKTFVFLRLTV